MRCDRDQSGLSVKFRLSTLTILKCESGRILRAMWRVTMPADGSLEAGLTRRTRATSPHEIISMMTGESASRVDLRLGQRRRASRQETFC